MINENNLDNALGSFMITSKEYFKEAEQANKDIMKAENVLNKSHINVEFEFP